MMKYPKSIFLISLISMFAAPHAQDGRHTLNYVSLAHGIIVDLDLVQAAAEANFEVRDGVELRYVKRRFSPASMFSSVPYYEEWRHLRADVIEVLLNVVD